MAELVVGKLLDATNAFLVEKLHIVTSISEEEVVSTNAQPEQVYLLVGIVSLVIDVRNISRGKRTIRAEIRELVEVRQAIKQCLVAATRETTNGAMVSVCLGAIVTLDIWHQVVDKIFAEGVAAKAGLWLTGSRQSATSKQLQRITIGHHNYHLLSIACCQQVVHDIVHSSDFVVHLLGVCRSADEVEHWIALLVVAHIVGGQIHHCMVGSTNGLRIVVDILHPAVCHIGNIMRQRNFLVAGRYLQQAVFETFVGEILRILRIHHANPIDNKAVGIHVRSCRAESHRPQTISATCHILTSGKLYVDHHVLGCFILVLKGYRPVSITARLCHHGHGQQGQKG